jgi:hypothetical protein
MTDLVQVKMLKPRMGYRAGQVASFVPHVAAMLIGNGAAEATNANDEPKPRNKAMRATEKVK